MQGLRLHRWSLPFVALVPLALSLLFAYDGMEFNGDAFRYFESARNLVNAWREGSPVQTGFWPLGYPFLSALLMMIAGTGFPAAQAVSLLTAGCSLYFILRIYKLEHPGRTIEVYLGILFLGLSGYWLRYATTVMSDMSALCWSVGAIYAIRRWSDGFAFRFLILTALFIALAIATRYVSGLVLIPVGIGILMSSADSRTRVRHFSALLLLVLLLLLPQLPFSLRMPEASVRHPWLTDWTTRHFFALDRTTIDGHLHVSRPNFFYYGLAPFRWSELSPVGGLLALSGVLFCLRRGLSRTDGMMATWFVVVWLFLSGIPIQNPRFALPLYVPTAWFLVAGLKQLRGRLPDRPFVIGLLLYIGVSGWAGLNKWRDFVKQKDTMLEAARAFNRKIPAAARILSWDFYEAFHIYLPSRKISTIHGLDRDALQELLNREGALYLIFDEDRLEQAWSGLEPSLAYRALLDRNPSELLEQEGPYTLRRCRSAGPAAASNSLPSSNP